MQFGIWLTNLLQGDLGESFYFKMPVTSLIGQRLEPTFMLALFTIVLAVAVSVPLGVLAAWRHGGWLDRGLMGFSVLGFSIPVFVLGYILIWIVSLKLNGWLPVQGYERIGEGFWPFVSHLILPSVTLAVIYIALIARVTRAAVSEALTEDYIRTARSKGLPEVRVLIKPRAGQRRGAHRHGDRHRHRAADRRRGRHRVGVWHSRPGPADGRRGAGARLPDDPGRDPVLLVPVRADQPAGGPVLPDLRSADPLLMGSRKPIRAARSPLPRQQLSDEAYEALFLRIAHPRRAAPATAARWMPCGAHPAHVLFPGTSASSANDGHRGLAGCASAVCCFAAAGAGRIGSRSRCSVTVDPAL